MLDKIKQAREAKKLGDQMAKAMAAEKIEIEEGEIKIIVSGAQVTQNQKVEELEVDGEERNDLKDVLNKAFKESQTKTTQKMLEMSGGLKGLLGG